mmetsp:Transcript_6002/g.13127  ORF Transcript_6002/g.13127 Transcript_6002/m.13127 type:complete len:226 (+) Transcript_6002:2260-2937(+)
MIPEPIRATVAEIDSFLLSHSIPIEPNGRPRRLQHFRRRADEFQILRHVDVGWNLQSVADLRGHGAGSIVRNAASTATTGPATGGRNTPLLLLRLLLLYLLQLGLPIRQPLLLLRPLDGPHDPHDGADHHRQRHHREGTALEPLGSKHRIFVPRAAARSAREPPAHPQLGAHVVVHRPFFAIGEIPRQGGLRTLRIRRRKFSVSVVDVSNEEDVVVPVRLHGRGG